MLNHRHVSADFLMIVRHPEQPGDMRRTLADLSLSSQELGYAARVPIEHGIAHFVAWWRAENGFLEH